MRLFLLSLLMICLSPGGPTWADSAGPDVSTPAGETLPPGYVRGDVVSYSYVPNRYWARAEAFGICPYLFEYGLTKWKSDTPLETFHAENIRRIDMVSKWSTVIGLCNRHREWQDEVVNLMIRCFRNRQLILLPARPNPQKPEKDSFNHFVALLERLWKDRDKVLVSPEGDRATGRQLINNILMADLGDEGLGALKTDGLARLNQQFNNRVQDRLMDGQRPFGHIKTWYNEVHYGIGCYAANQEDLAKGKVKWPSNSEFIGVDVYHYWSFDHTPFDPDDVEVPRWKVVQHAIAWQNVITKYHGPDFRVTMGEGWDPKHRNDTHAMLQAIDLAGAKRAMMIYIGNTQYVVGSCYTTPIETMDAFYDSVKAGPWVGLSWWVFDTGGVGGGTLDYLDGKLRHYTPANKKGKPYTTAELENYRKRFIESRMRMFNDVVYNQFGHLNGPRPASENKE